MDEVLKYEANHQNGDSTENVRSEVIETILYQRSLKLAQQAKTISEPHFYISAYFEENKDRYIDTMRQVSVTGDWNDWCLFFLEAVERQVINNSMYSQTQCLEITHSHHKVGRVNGCLPDGYSAAVFCKLIWRYKSI